MKAIILAGGFAKRLWPLTKEKAKPLIAINGQPLISYIVHQLSALHAIDEIIVTTNARFADDFRRWKNALSSPLPISIVVENSLSEEHKLGAVGGIRSVLDTYDINDDILVVAGDNYMGVNFSAMLALFAQKKTPIIASYDVKDRTIAARMGEVTCAADGRVTCIREKPPHPETTLISTCCYMFPRGIRQDLARYLDEGGNKDAPGFFIAWLAQQKSIYAFVFDTFWFDIGDHESLTAARRFAERS